MTWNEIRLQADLLRLDVDIAELERMNEPDREVKAWNLALARADRSLQRLKEIADMS